MQTGTQKTKATTEGDDVAERNFSSDAFRKGVTSGTPSSPVRGGPGFRPRKTKLGNTTPSTGEAAPRSVAVAKAFAQENPQHNVRPGPRDKAHLHSRRRPTNPHRPIQRANDAPVATTVAKQRGPPPPSTGPTVPAEQRQHHAPHPRTSRRPTLAAAAATRQNRWHAHHSKCRRGRCCPHADVTHHH
jgi:hypothetical protein